MEISENLLSLFTADIEKRGDLYFVQIPEREVEIGSKDEGKSYRIAVLPSQSNTDSKPEQAQRPAEPPVAEGDTVDLEIENIGDQGDGIARVPPGYVIIVPDTEVGERVAVQVTEARENVAFAEVLKRYDR